MTGAERHRSWLTLKPLVDRGPPVTEPIVGDPLCRFNIGELGLSVSLDVAVERGDPLPELQLRNVTAGHVDTPEGHFLRLLTEEPRIYREFYGLACNIADRIQLDGRPTAAAIVEALEAASALIRSRTGLTDGQEVGLIGELRFMTILAERTTWDQAIDSWEGFNFEEHDFVLSQADIEVKTTRSERRVHEISSLEQLDPKEGRALHVASLQLTRSLMDPLSVTVNDAVDGCLDRATAAGSSRLKRLERGIEEYGWRAQDRDLYLEGYVVRHDFELVRVDGEFPRIVPTQLDPATRNRIAHVRYEIDLTDLGSPLSESLTTLEEQ